MSKFSMKVLRAAALVFAADASAIAAHVRKALVEKGLVGADAVPAETRGRKVKTVKAILIDFASGADVSRIMVGRLVDAGYVKIDLVKEPGRRGGPRHVPVLTAKGKSVYRLHMINAERRKAKETAKVTAKAEVSTTPDAVAA